MQPSSLLMAVTAILCAAMPARSGVLDGQTVNLTYFTPNLSTPFADGGTFTVPHAFNGFEFGQINVDVADANILVTFNGPFSFTCCRAYNGWVLTDETSAPIASVTIDPSTNVTGFMFSFDASHVYVNWPGLQGDSSSVISLDVAAAPEPHTALISGLGLVALSLLLRRKRDDSACRRPSTSSPSSSTSIPSTPPARPPAARGWD